MASKKKMTLYFSEELFEETRREAERQDRSVSWVLQMAWRMSRDKLREMPGMQDFAPTIVDGEGELAS